MRDVSYIFYHILSTDAMYAVGGYAAASGVAPAVQSVERLELATMTWTTLPAALPTADMYGYAVSSLDADTDQ